MSDETKTQANNEVASIGLLEASFEAWKNYTGEIDAEFVWYVAAQEKYYGESKFERNSRYFHTGFVAASNAEIRGEKGAIK